MSLIQDIELSMTSATAGQYKPFKLSDYRGKTVVLYFYPKDSTPGCTTESMGFRDAYNELGLGPGITYHANRFWFRIDHILYKGNMEARWLVRQRHKSSDHYPLVTRFVWENSENH